MTPTVIKSTNREQGPCMCCNYTPGRQKPYDVYEFHLGTFTARLCDEHLLDLREAIVSVAGTLQKHQERFPE